MLKVYLFCLISFVFIAGLIYIKEESGTIWDIILLVTLNWFVIIAIGVINKLITYYFKYYNSIIFESENLPKESEIIERANLFKYKKNSSKNRLHQLIYLFKFKHSCKKLIKEGHFK